MPAKAENANLLIKILMISLREIFYFSLGHIGAFNI